MSDHVLFKTKLKYYEIRCDGPASSECHIQRHGQEDREFEAKTGSSSGKSYPVRGWRASICSLGIWMGN